MTFEEAEKAHLASGWTAARGEARHAREDVCDASRDAWTRVSYQARAPARFADLGGRAFR